jgi:AraC family transcriptional regulator of adaptative response / DNA-3-methyladenine glycosylase II
VCDYFSGKEPGDMDTVLGELLEIPGVGPWTTTLLGMRGFGDPDCFPVTDLGIVKAARSLESLDKPELLNRIDSWRPWRSYAANLLWRTLSL